MPASSPTCALRLRMSRAGIVFARASGCWRIRKGLRNDRTGSCKIRGDAEDRSGTQRLVGLPVLRRFSQGDKVSDGRRASRPRFVSLRNDWLPLEQVCHHARQVEHEGDRMKCPRCNFDRPQWDFLSTSALRGTSINQRRSTSISDAWQLSLRARPS